MELTEFGYNKQRLINVPTVYVCNLCRYAFHKPIHIILYTVVAYFIIL